MIQAAKDKGVYAIGVDSNQDDIAPGVVLTSMLKLVDVAVYNLIKEIARTNSFTIFFTKNNALLANNSFFKNLIKLILLQHFFIYIKLLNSLLKWSFPAVVVV